jgi:hypothetical protein
VPTFRWTPESTVELHATSSVHPIEGDIRELRGEAVCDVENGRLVPGPNTSAWLEADVEQLKANNKLEDIALRKQIDAKRYPTVRYEVRRVEGGPDTFKLSGAFTFHGVTQEFVEECRATLDAGQLRVEGEHSFDIRDFGVKPFKLLGMQIHPEVRLVVRLIGTEARSGGWS